MKEIVEKVWKREINDALLFGMDSAYSLWDFGQEFEYFKHIVWTENLRKMAVLAGQAWLYNEPVLLVGETGCGKTSLCQVGSDMRLMAWHVRSCKQCRFEWYPLIKCCKWRFQCTVFLLLLP